MSSNLLQNDDEVNEARATLFRALGDPTRLRIYQTLIETDKPLNVTELCERTDLSYNLVSHHLQCLNNCTLVEAKQEGRKRFYRVAQQAGPRMVELADECIRQDIDSVLGCDIARAESDMDTPNDV
ncbi:ArsR/SmtB family transcription factor [Halomarina rubra]|uniref:ArsR/SmtB family transcription factor n=1 Tax=Halomarina rubra TaxID=2071873 RepID=A0ABD6AYS2_9EURY|nr:metalloregulator ArsR/SmtB family transcription factor [Halomarina rubra]